MVTPRKNGRALTVSIEGALLRAGTWKKFQLNLSLRARRADHSFVAIMSSRDDLNERRWPATNQAER
jgi:hypothetical protein